MEIELRPYQTQAIDEARARLVGGAKRVLIVMATGGGKTIVAAEIIRSAQAKGSRVLFLAHRRELIAQTVDKLRRFGVEPGVIMAGHKMAPERQVQVASVQSLRNRVATAGDFDLLFVDEAHHVTKENTYSEMLELWPAARVVGLTATPWRLDGKGLADTFDSHVIVRTPKQLRDEGFLVGVSGWQYTPISTKGAKVSGGDFTAKSLEEPAMAPRVMGDIVWEWKVHAGNAQTVLFACTIAHSMAMTAAFRAAGVMAEHLDCDTPKDERAAILSRIASGETRVMCNVGIATEGWDCPSLSCVILARPTLSTSLFLQMVGRVLRPLEGKRSARIHDHAGCLASHGHPYADRDFSPTKSAKVKRGDGEAKAPECKKCGAVIDCYPCAECGYAPEPREIEAELDARRVAISESMAPISAAQKKAEAWRQRSMVSKYNLYQALKKRHGWRMACGIYKSMSGETEWPQRAWQQ